MASQDHNKTWNQGSRGKVKNRGVPRLPGMTK